jgi:CBS domain-containing protein
MGLRQEILEAPVTELDWRKLLTISATAPVREAIALMQSKRLGCVVVVDEAGKALGKFTERDLLRLMLLNPKDLDNPVGQNMSGTWATVNQSETVGKVIECMDKSKLRFVIIIDDDGKAVGLTGQKGVIEYIVDHFPRQVKVHMMESKLYMDAREGG